MKFTKTTNAAVITASLVLTFHAQTILGFGFAKPTDVSAIDKKDSGSANFGSLLLSRHKRSLFSLCEMISQYTGRSCFQYTSYGNWCGLGGAGGCVDDVDDCCYSHDLCYGYYEKHLKCETYFNGYQTLKSAVDGNFSCNARTNSECEEMICQCDLRIAECLQKYNDKFDMTFAGVSSATVRYETSRKCAWEFKAPNAMNISVFDVHYRRRSRKDVE